MQGDAACVDPDRHLILQDRHPHRKTRTGLGKRACVVTLRHPFHHRFFHNRLDVTGGEQFTPDAGRLRDPELRVTRKKTFPLDRARALKELLVAFRVKCSRLDQDPFRRAQKHVGVANRLPVSFKGNLTVLHL